MGNSPGAAKVKAEESVDMAKHAAREAEATVAEVVEAAAALPAAAGDDADVGGGRVIGLHQARKVREAMRQMEWKV